MELETNSKLERRSFVYLEAREEKWELAKNKREEFAIYSARVTNLGQALECYGHACGHFRVSALSSCLIDFGKLFQFM